MCEKEPKWAAPKSVPDRASIAIPLSFVPDEVEAEKRRSPSEIYLRGVWSMRMTFEECCDMMFSYDERRAKWDGNSAGTIELLRGESLTANDMVTRVGLNLGFLLRMAGVPTSITARNVRRWDWPYPGAVTYAMVPWDAEQNKFDENNSILTLKVGTIAPHPEKPGHALMTSLETNKFGGIPK